MRKITTWQHNRNFESDIHLASGVLYLLTCLQTTSILSIPTSKICKSQVTPFLSRV